MKIIEAMREIKTCHVKIEDTVKLINENGADLEHLNPKYGTPEEQTKQVQAWIDRIRDLTVRISDLKLRLSKTNNSTIVTIVINGNAVTKSITEWIYRRTTLATLEANSWRALGIAERALRPQNIEVLDASGSKAFKISNIRRFYNVKRRDDMITQITSEPSLIDGALEVCNSTTDLVEA